MARVVGIHGINNTYRGPGLMAGPWRDALLSGVQLAGGEGMLSAEDIGCVFYGHIFRRGGRPLAPDAPRYGPAGADEGYERELRLRLWTAADEVDPHVVAPRRRAIGLVSTVRAAFAALTASRLLSSTTDRALVLALKQVHAYFADATVRATIQRRFRAAIGPDTRVVVAHSLGSVIAYEALCAHPDWHVPALVTLGSPLGIRRLIFDRLRPPPLRTSAVGEPQGAWPGNVDTWTNISESADFVAMVKKLAPLFGGRIIDIDVDNGLRVHDVLRYLTAVETGQAIVAGLNLD